MVLHSAQYKRQNNEDAAFEDIMDSNLHVSGGDGGGSGSGGANRESQGGGSSIINSNSISLGNAASSRNSMALSAAEAGRVRVDSANSEDALSTGSDRMCNAPEGHVRFVNSTIRYHMAGPGFWYDKQKIRTAKTIMH